MRRVFVNVAGAGRIDGADVAFSWNSTYLSVASITLGSALPIVLKNEIGASSASFAAGIGPARLPLAVSSSPQSLSVPVCLWSPRRPLPGARMQSSAAASRQASAGAT